MIQLHYFPGNASMTPHFLLEELGVPFELKRVETLDTSKQHWIMSASFGYTFRLG